MAVAVIAVEVAVGQDVAAGAALAVVEAMKMHHPLRAQHAGRIEAVHIKPGDVIAADDIVIQLDPSVGGSLSVSEEPGIALADVPPTRPLFSTDAASFSPPSGGKPWPAVTSGEC